MRRICLVLAFLFLMVCTQATSCFASDLGAAEEQYRKRIDIKNTLRNLGKNTYSPAIQEKPIQGAQEASNNKEMPWLSLLLNPPAISPGGPSAYILVVQVL